MMSVALARRVARRQWHPMALFLGFAASTTALSPFWAMASGQYMGSRWRIENLLQRYMGEFATMVATHLTLGLFVTGVVCLLAALLVLLAILSTPFRRSLTDALDLD